MGRIFFFLLLALASYIAWLWLRRNSLHGPVSGRDNPRVPQAMVSCAHCGLHVPKIDALPADDLYFCSEDHRRRGAAS
jgi:uncharacterized protein